MSASTGWLADRPVKQGRHTGRVVISRRWAAFLVLVGVWTWVIWPRFGLAIYRDERSFSDGRPTAFLWVHALLIGASLVIGTTVGVLGIKAWRSAKSSAGRVAAPQD